MRRSFQLALFAGIGIGLACSSPTSNDGGPPTLTLAATPPTISAGQSSVLGWTTTNATSCTASGGWTGSKATADTQTVTPATSTTYSLSCTGAGGTTNHSVTVTVHTPPPTVTITATPSTIAPGDSSNLSWSATGATTCTASGAWGGTKATAGSGFVKPATTSTYTLACTGGGGTASQSAIVTVSSTPVVTVALSASPSSITSGQQSTLTWSSSGATSCLASGGWTGGKALSGNAPVSPTATTTYTLTCNDAGSNSAAQSVTVNVGSGPPPGAYVYPLKVGPTGHYLTDQNDQPFYLAGDAAWSLIAQLSVSDANTYLDNRQQLGFDLILVNLIEHKFATNAPANIANQSPFTGTAFQSGMNEAYFAHADSIVQAAADHGIVVLLAPIYLGSGCASGGSDEGWCVELNAASVSQMTAWGTYVGNRYKGYTNIVWVMGGDADPTQPAAVKSRVEAVINGIRAVDTGHLMTSHGNFGQTAVSEWGRPSWLAINDLYTYELGNTIYQDILASYNVAPAIPVFLIESKYENETYWGVTQQQLRSQAYWTVLSGGFGNIFGNCPIWNFDTPGHGAYCPQTGWQAELTGQGSRNMQYAVRLFTARHWHLLVPNTSVLTTTAQTGATFARAAKASDNSSIIVYLPTQRQVTVNVSALTSGTVTGYWYNPSTGVATSLGTFPTTSNLTTTPPSAGDWVLVVDNDSFGFPSP